MNVNNKVYEDCKKEYLQILAENDTRIGESNDSIENLEKIIETAKAELIEAAKTGDSERYAAIRNEKEMAEIRIISEKQELSSLLEKEAIVDGKESKAFHDAIGAEIARIVTEADRKIMASVNSALETWKQANLTIQLLEELEKRYSSKVEKNKSASITYRKPDLFMKIEELGDSLYTEFYRLEGVPLRKWKRDMHEAYSDEIEKMDEGTR